MDSMDKNFTDSLLNLAVDAAKEAGAVLREQFGKTHDIKFKREIDVVTESDLLAEKIIIEKIKSKFPSHSILTEEAGSIDGSNDVCWVIDPLDGTTNFSHDFPVFSVSIGIEVEGVVIAGAVYHPMLHELFTAKKGEGAYLNGKKIKVSNISSIGKALLSTGFPYDVHYSAENNLNYFSAFTLKAQAIRRAGSAALDLCYVACGRFDGFWEMKLSPWDTAAGGLIVLESGGKMTDFKNNSFNIREKEVLATNGLIHNEMLETIAKAGEQCQTPRKIS